MAFLYTDIEDSIVARLAPVVPVGYKVMVMPEKENQFDIGSNKVLILVAYSESSFDKSDSMDIVNQTENVTIICNVKSPRLRGSFSINEALRILKIMLVGFKPANLSKLQASKIEFISRNTEDNYFSYNFSLTGEKRNVEVPDDETLPLLKKITFNGKEGDFYAPDFNNSDFQTATTYFEVISKT